MQPFSYDESHPYSAGQHRGIDIGADATGETVVAPAAGTVSFAGYVAANGETVTIETSDGYSVTLTHLGTIAVTKGATVAEQQAIGTVGPSGTPEVDGPYVHLGIRVSADPNGYVDPLSLLPAVPASGGTAQTGSTSAVSTSPAKKPAASPSPRPRVTTTARGRGNVGSEQRGRTQAPTTDARPRRSSQRPTTRDARTPLESKTPRSQPSEQPSAFRRPLDESAIHGISHESRPTMDVAPSRPGSSNALPGLVCNWAAALFALGAALVVGRRRSTARPTASAEVLRLRPPDAQHGQVSRAA